MSVMSNLDSFLNTSSTVAILYTFGKVPFANYLFISVDRRIEVDFLITLLIL